MAPLLPQIRRFGRDRQGSTAVEFALIGPTMIAMLLGVLQVGTGMKAYNAMRGASGDLARYAVVNDQQTTTEAKLTDAQLIAYGRSVGISGRYQLSNDRLDVDVRPAATQRIAGATEKTITMTYSVPSVLGIIGMQDIQLTYTRPVFLL